MQKRKRVARRPAPHGLVSGAELTRWAVYGPGVGEGRAWPSWQAWAEVYANCREAWLAQREERRLQSASNAKLEGLMLDWWHTRQPAAERIFQAMSRGEDPDTVQADIVHELGEHDPRRILAGAAA